MLLALIPLIDEVRQFPSHACAAKTHKKAKRPPVVRWSSFELNILAASSTSIGLLTSQVVSEGELCDTAASLVVSQYFEKTPAASVAQLCHKC